MKDENFLIETSLNDGSEQTQIKSIDGQTLKANIDKLTALVQQFGQDSAGNLELDEVSISIKINGEGEVILVGNGQSACNTMTLRFRRPARSFSNLTQTISKPQEILASAVGVNYANLQSLLAAGQWQQANQETWDVMCQALHKNKGSYLSSEDINQLPCQDLETIDRLWQKYSQGKFGFSAQKNAYKTAK
jgi:hypothetical protein